VVAVNPVTNQIYVADEGDGIVTVIDGASNQTASLTLAAPASAMAMNPVADKFYIANKAAGTVTLLSANNAASVRVSTALNALVPPSVVSPTPALTGLSVDQWPAPAASEILAALVATGTWQAAWNLAGMGSGFGSDSATWSWNWGGQSLLPGENYLRCAALESNAASTTICGLGTPFTGNVSVSPLYLVSQPTAVRKAAGIKTSLVAVTISRSGIVYSLPQAAIVSVSLFDLQGRKIKALCNTYQQAGPHRINAPLAGLPAAHYLAVFKAGAMMRAKLL
jgi:hypothetical protein